MGPCCVVSNAVSLVTQVCYDLFCFLSPLSLVLHLCLRSIVAVHLLPKQVVRVRSSSWAYQWGGCNECLWCITALAKWKPHYKHRPMHWSKP